MWISAGVYHVIVSDFKPQGAFAYSPPWISHLGLWGLWMELSNRDLNPWLQWLLRYSLHLFTWKLLHLQKTAFATSHWLTSKPGLHFSFVFRLQGICTLCWRTYENWELKQVLSMITFHRLSGGSLARELDWKSLSSMEISHRDIFILIS